MRFFLCFPFLALLLPSCTLVSPPSPSKNLSPTQRVPFEYEGGHIYLQASLNGSPLRWFILDSGSTHTLINQSQAQSLGLKSQSTVEIKGIGTKKTPATLSSGVAFNLAGVTWASPEVLVVPPSFLTPLQQYFGREFSGIIGADLFEQFVTKVDYSEQVLHLSDAQTYRYQGTGDKIPLKLRKGKPYIQSTLWPSSDQSFKSQLLVDLGSAAALDINEPVTPKLHQWLSQTPALPRLTLGAGGEKAVRIGRIQQLQIGNLKLEKPITEFSLGQPRPQKKISGRIGSQILSQFQVTLDYQRKHMILESPSQKKGASHYDMSGLWLKTQGKPFDQVWVDRVFANSPAATEDIRAGDRILAINNQPVEKFSLAQVRSQLKQPSQVELQIQRQQKKLTVKLTLKPLI